MPPVYDAGDFFDVHIKFFFSVLGWHQGNTLRNFDFDGADLGVPVVYKWTGTTAPDFTEAVPDDLSETDWELLATPPANLQGEWFDDHGNWLGDVAQYYLMRFTVPESTYGIWQGRLKTVDEGGTIFKAIDP